jgi:hypothetical protein
MGIGSAIPNSSEICINKIVVRIALSLLHAINSRLSGIFHEHCKCAISSIASVTDWSLSWGPESIGDGLLGILDIRCTLQIEYFLPPKSHHHGYRWWHSRKSIISSKYVDNFKLSAWCLHQLLQIACLRHKPYCASSEKVLDKIVHREWLQNIWLLCRVL